MEDIPDMPNFVKLAGLVVTAAIGIATVAAKVHETIVKKRQHDYEKERNSNDNARQSEAHSLKIYEEKIRQIRNNIDYMSGRLRDNNTSESEKKMFQEALNDLNKELLALLRTKPEFKPI